MVEKRNSDTEYNDILLDRRSALTWTGSALLTSSVGGALAIDESSRNSTAEQSSELTVGANYYPWYGRGTHVDWLDETVEDPVLGSYDSRDPEVIDQHLEWCRAYGIDWLSMSWWGQQSAEDVTIRDHVLSRELGETEFSIFYETPGILTDSGDSTFNLDDGENREQLVSDVAYLADTYFTNPQYRRIDDRPVLYLYIAGTFRGDIAGAFEAMRDASPEGLYIVADLIRFGPPLEEHEPVIEAADAVTSYNMYSPQDDINEDFVERATDVYDQWVDPLARANTEFIPVVIPGYDDTELEHVSRDNPPLHASPELFREFCQEATPYATDGASSIFITSFNEWYENTQIEPSGQFGTEYLNVVSEEFGTTNDRSDSNPTEVELQFGRTVPEDELEGGMENPRDLAFQCFAIDILNSSGEAVASYDIGSEGAEPGFESGAYQREQIPDEDGETSSWRWFGGPEARTVIHIDGALEDVDSLVLHGGAAEGTIETNCFRDGQYTDTVGIDGRSPDDYRCYLTAPGAGSLRATTRDVASVGPTSATLRGSIAELTDSASVYFNWRQQGDSDWNRSSEQTLSTPGAFSTDLDGLAPASDYEYQAVAEPSDGGPAHGGLVQFTTDVGNDAPAIDSYELTDVGASDSHLAVSTRWEVSDENGDLDTAILQVFRDSGSLVDATTTDITGYSASTSGTDGVTVRYPDGETFTVRLTVVDSYGNSASQTRTVTT